MLGIWMNVVCLKCGNKESKKYFVDTIDKFDKFFGVSCSCGNKDCEHFKLLDFETTNRGKQI